MDIGIGEGHRPRNVGWARAAALLYGDWGTSKAYVLGLAFAVAGFSSLPIILAVCLLTGLVGINYAVICAYFPDGGGVYSAARSQGRLLAVIGALLLVADLTVTAALSGWSALSYFNIPILKEHIVFSTIGVLVFMGWVNWYGPKHSGAVAVALSVPTVVVVIALIAISVPHLTVHHLEPLHESYGRLWVQFVGAILALSGVEAIANLTGVMKLDPGSSPEHPKVGREAAKAIWPVALEVVGGTALLGWAMLSLPASLKPEMSKRTDDMLRFVAEQFGGMTFGPSFGHVFGWVVGIVFFLLLLSAANTAIVAMIGLLYMMARDEEMPRQFKQLNSHGVPLIPLLIAVVLPIVVLTVSADFEALAGLYAIGVVGAITVNLGSCTFNRTISFSWIDRSLFGVTFFVLFAVEITLARTKPDALFFVLCVLGLGLGLRAYTQKIQGLTTVTLTRERRADRERGGHRAPAARVARRAEDHGRRARHHARAAVRARGSRAAKGDALRPLRERTGHLRPGRLTEQGARQMAGGTARRRHHVAHDEDRKRAEHHRRAGLRGQRRPRDHHPRPLGHAGDRLPHARLLPPPFDDEAPQRQRRGESFRRPARRDPTHHPRVTHPAVAHSASSVVYSRFRCSPSAT